MEENMNHSPTSSTEKEFIYIEDANSEALTVPVRRNSLTSSKKSLCSNASSFTDVLNVDFEPKMTHDHNDDVCKLVAEAQMDDYFPNYYDTKPMSTEGKSRASSEPEQSSSDEDVSIKRTASESSVIAASIMFHNLTYLGSSAVNAPVSELELRRTMSILRDQIDVCIPVILSISLSPSGDIRLIDPDTRTDIASYNISKLCFWGKGDSDNREKDCLAFNISHGEEDPSFQCHVFKCNEEDDVAKIIQSLAQTIKRDKKRKQDFPLKRRSVLDPNNLEFKFNVTLDLWEDDSKGSYQTVARDRNHFKLRNQLQKKVVLILEQVTNRKLHIERCFGLLLAQGRGVPEQDLHLLEQIQMDYRPGGRVIISGHWDPNLEHWKILNTDTGKDNRIYMTVAADLIFDHLKEPVRIIKEVKVRVFPLNEKFWNPSKPKISEEYTLLLKENFTELGEKYFEKESLLSETDLVKAKASNSGFNNGLASFWRSGNKDNKYKRSESITTEAEEIKTPEEEDDDEEPLLSGSGQIERQYSEEEMNSWAEALQKWKDNDSRPSKVVHLVKKGIPNALRGQIWQIMAGIEEESELLNSYSYLTKKDSPQEQVILWDVTRTFPAHHYFQEAGGEGQNALYNISKAYSVYDEEVGYCQGLSFLIAVFLLHVPEEQAYCLLVKIMYDYGHRDLFKNCFDSLHQSFYVLERLMEDYLQELYLHFRAINIEMHMFASQWFLTLFTSKFPLPLVYHIIDLILCEGCDVMFQIALAFLKDSNKELLSQDFEGVLKYFRINLPKKYMNDSNKTELINIAYSFKISKKRLQKYKHDYIQMKEEIEMKEDPIVRLQRENQRLVEENLRLERENDNLAYEIVTTQVTMQEVITDREEKVNVLTKETEKNRKHLMDGEEEMERLKLEEIRIKDMWRDSMVNADEEKAKRDRIIEDYKHILTRLEARNEKLKKEMEADMELLKLYHFLVEIGYAMSKTETSVVCELKVTGREKESSFENENVLQEQQVSSCENCTTALLNGLYNKNEDGETLNETSAQKKSLSPLLPKDDKEEQIRSLETELIKTKVALAEEKNRADEIEMKLHNLTVANEKPWYKKVAINNKR